MPATPFKPSETRLGAAFGASGDWELPVRFLPVLEEVGRGRSLGGIVDRSDWGKLWLAGKDAADFLHNYTTHDVKALAPGKGIQTAVTTWKGTMVDHVFVMRREDGLWVLTHPGRSRAVKDALEKYLLGVDVTLEDRTEGYGLLYVFGQLSRPVMAKATGLQPSWPQHAPVPVRIGGAEALVASTWGAFGEGYHVLVTNDAATTVYDALVREADAKGMLPIGSEAWERLRIEQGIPAFGHEITEAVNPWEARLADSVSMAKGCYLGQEVIARLANYDKVQRYLVGLRFEGDRLPEQGAEIHVDDKKVGVVTSACAELGLGFVKGAYVAPGTRVVVKTGDKSTPAMVEARPFWSGLVNEGIGPRY
ncbi:MAG TPA: glycine cleavage T C-terminal barrel domain-containing protein [Pantanalinema sp.]